MKYKSFFYCSRAIVKLHLQETKGMPTPIRVQCYFVKMINVQKINVTINSQCLAITFCSNSIEFILSFDLFSAHFDWQISSLFAFVINFEMDKWMRRCDVARNHSIRIVRTQWNNNDVMYILISTARRLCFSWEKKNKNLKNPKEENDEKRMKNYRKSTIALRSNRFFVPRCFARITYCID